MQALLGSGGHRRLAARVRDWPRLLDDAEDICQLAVIAFVEAWRRGGIAPDESGAHTPRSVAAYAWGIVNRVFAGLVRRSLREAQVEVDSGAGLQTRGDQAGLKTSPTGYGIDLLDELLGPGESEDERLWDVLSSVEQSCRAEDIIVTYLLASGVSPGEMRRLLGVSVNTPQNALRRVGRELRGVLGLEERP